MTWRKVLKIIALTIGVIIMLPILGVVAIFAYFYFDYRGNCSDAGGAWQEQHNCCYGKRSKPDLACPAPPQLRS